MVRGSFEMNKFEFKISVMFDCLCCSLILLLLFVVSCVVSITCITGNGYNTTNTVQ